jgi:hypothetical protein
MDSVHRGCEKRPHGNPAVLELGLWLVLMIAVILALPFGVGGAAFQTRVSVPHASSLRAPTSDQQNTALRQAEASLEKGQGPANGFAIHCSPNGGGLRCSSSQEGDRHVNAIAGATAAPPSYLIQTLPSPRYGAVLATFFNGTTAQDVLLFGGADAQGHVYNDTWQFNSTSHTWWDVTPYQHCTTTSCPSARHDAAGIYDALDGYVVVFGGCSVASPKYTQSVPSCDTTHILGDTWTYDDPAGGVGSWTQLTTLKTQPSPRYSAGVATDSTTSGVILFGGCGSTCPLSDTWLFASGAWTDITTSVGVPPTARFGMAFGYSGSLQSGFADILFGGCSSSLPSCNSGQGILRDTWELRGSAYTWSNVLTSGSCATKLCPTARYLMAYSSYQGPAGNWVLVLYGGVGTYGTIYGDSTDVMGQGWWYFSYVSGSWGQANSPLTYNHVTAWITPFPVAPPVPRYDGMLVGLGCDGLQMFGGSSQTGSSLGDSWWAATAPSDGCVPGIVTPLPVPSPEFGGSMVYDSLDSYDLLFSGCGSNCSNGTTWTYTAGSAQPWNSLWPSVNSANSPTARMNASMVYYVDPSHGVQEAILFGGVSATGTLLGDTWKFTGGTWAQLSLSGPSPREAAAFAFVSGASPYAVLFGGCGSTCPLGDTWELTWGTNGLAWSQLNPVHSPAARYGAAITYDPHDLYVVLFGGCGSTCPLSDTWEFAAGTWSQCGCSSSPGARWGAGMVWDAYDGYALLVGGCSASCPLSDSWTFVGGRWTQTTPLPVPMNRVSPAIAYDSSGSYVLVVGGMGPNNSLQGGPGWAYQSSAWIPFVQTNEIPRFFAPGPRYGVTLAYNSSGGQVLLFGGCQDTGVGTCGPALGNDTWLFVNGSWNQVLGCDTPSCVPSPRFAYSLAYDARDGYFLLVGGCTASSLTCTASSVLSDYWAFGAGWKRLGTLPFQGRADGSMAYDSGDRSVVLLGGIGCGSICSDSWLYSAGTWTKITGSNQPGAREGAAMAYDGYTTAQYIVMTGGYGGGGTVYSDVWSFTVASGWSKLSASGGVAVYDAQVAYDPVSESVLLFGGGTSGGTTSAAMWSYQSGGTWQRIIIGVNSGQPEPGPRVFGGMVFDADAGPEGIVLLYGGCIGADGASPGQGSLWEFLNGGNPTWYDVSLVQ